MHAFVVMPDHVHLLLTPLRGTANEVFSVSEIMAGIKGASAHGVNQALDRRGKVWEKEYFDHIVRKGNMDAKYDYVLQNAVAMKLVEHPADYPWLWTNPDYL
jgi:REP element-mobilizing transposase RayT